MIAHKMIDTENGQVAAMTNVAQIFYINPIIAGTAISQRCGNKIIMKKLQLRRQLSQHTGFGQDSTDTFAGRWIIVHDTQPNAALPAFADMFASIATNGTTAATMYSFQNPNNQDRFEVLFDELFTCPPSGTSGAGGGAPASHANDSQNWNSAVELDLNHIAVYNNVNGGTIADITTGSLILINIAEGAGGYINVVQSRLWFYDQN